MTALSDNEALALYHLLRAGPLAHEMMDCLYAATQRFYDASGLPDDHPDGDPRSTLVYELYERVAEIDGALHDLEEEWGLADQEGKATLLNKEVHRRHDLLHGNGHQHGNGPR